MKNPLATMTLLSRPLMNSDLQFTMQQTTGNSKSLSSCSIMAPMLLCVTVQVERLWRDRGKTTLTRRILKFSWKAVEYRTDYLRQSTSKVQKPPQQTAARVFDIHFDTPPSPFFRATELSSLTIIFDALPYTAPIAMMYSAKD